MFGRASSHLQNKHMRLRYGGPFIMFIQNNSKMSNWNGKDELKRIEDESWEIIKEWKKFATFKNWCHFQELPDWEKGPVRYLEPVENVVEEDVSDALLLYFLYKKLPVEKKEKYVEIYQKRYDVKIPNGFSKEYVKIAKPEKIKKTAFILWMNYYLRNKVSLEILSIDSFDLALKLGEIWNNLPMEERCKWEALLQKDKYKPNLAPERD